MRERAMKQIFVTIAFCLAIIFIALMMCCNDGNDSHGDSKALCSEPVKEPIPGITVYSGCQPPYTKDELGAHNIHLINNSHAIDVSWDDLRAFLVEDNTNEETYSEEEACGEFAEKVHNNAESNGIKAAIAVINLESTAPHALNVFDTIDKGLVYVDCTGPESRTEMSYRQWKYERKHSNMYDKVAYVAIGKELGFISIGSNPPFIYDLYEWRQNNSASIIWESIGIVQSVEIYW